MASFHSRCKRRNPGDMEDDEDTEEDVCFRDLGEEEEEWWWWSLLLPVPSVSASSGRLDVGREPVAVVSVRATALAAVDDDDDDDALVVVTVVVVVGTTTLVAAAVTRIEPNITTTCTQSSRTSRPSHKRRRLCLVVIE